MFAEIKPSWAADVFPEGNRRLAPVPIDGSSSDPSDRAVGNVVAHLDEPAERCASVPDTAAVSGVWHIRIAGILDIGDLGDAECAAIARAVANGAGFQDQERAHTRWVSARSHQDHTLHIVASPMGNDDTPISVDREGVHRACREIDEHIHRQNHALLGRAVDERVHGTIAIRDHPALGVAHASHVDDHLAELLLAKAGFRSTVLGAGYRTWRTPYGTDPEQRAHIASTALGYLNAADYDVSIQTFLLTKARPDHDIGSAERRVADLTGDLMWCFDANDVADTTAEINATLHEIATFTRALGTWAEQRLGDSAHAARLADAVPLLDRAAEIINRDPAEAPSPHPNEIVTRAATAHTTTRTRPGITPTSPATPPPPPTDSAPRRAR